MARADRTIADSTSEPVADAYISGRLFHSPWMAKAPQSALLVESDENTAVAVLSFRLLHVGGRSFTDPYQIPEGDHAGPMGVGEPPSWGKAAMDVAMCLILATCGGGFLSVDTLLLRDLLSSLG